LIIIEILLGYVIEISPKLQMYKDIKPNLLQKLNDERPAGTAAKQWAKS
jgi:hypothetical protein